MTQYTATRYASCRWFFPVAVVCRESAPTQVFGLSHSHFGQHRLKKRYLIIFSALTQQGEPEKALAKASAFFNEVHLTVHEK